MNPPISPQPAGTPSAASELASSRRGFLKKGTAVSAVAASTLATTRVLRGDEPATDSPRLLRIGLVGAGGRGSGAIKDSLTINENIKLTTIADLDDAKLAPLRSALVKRFETKVDVADEKMHGGIDGYRRILDDPTIDVVLFATPPGFRPSHISAAVDAGKHVFAEKPVCVDPAGYHVCLKAHQQAEANGTSIVTGTQYRRQTNYVEGIKRIHDGAIGEVISATARYCSNGIWNRIRKDGMSDTEYQIFNWMHFIWLSGDQIVEQAVHNVDTINWIMGGPPESAFGGGGRFTRPAGSEMWDSVHVDYSYPGNRLVSFTCRQIPNTRNDNSNVIHGTSGIATIYGGNRGCEITDRAGKPIWSMKGDISEAYQREHKDLIDSVRSGKPLIELRQTAESSLTAVMGRLAAYTGQLVSWDFVSQQSQLDLFPSDFNIEARPEPEYAVPGKTKLI